MPGRSATALLAAGAFFAALAPTAHAAKPRPRNGFAAVQRGNGNPLGCVNVVCR